MEKKVESIDDRFINEKFENASSWEIFDLINAQKQLNHSANKICWNKEEHIFAVRCNCGKGTFNLEVQHSKLLMVSANSTFFSADYLIDTRPIVSLHQ